MARKPGSGQMSEDDEQVLFVNWLNIMGIRFYAIPNGGSRHLWEAVKLKRTGVVAGVPDLCIPVPANGFHGLYIEMKKKNGGVASEKQLEWLDFLNKQGYKAEIANGCEAAKAIVLQYI